MALLTQESLVSLSRHPSWELWLGCWLLLELGGCRRQAVNRKWLSKIRWNMPGAGAGQEIAEQLNGLKRMLSALLPEALAHGLSTHSSRLAL